MCWAVSMDLEMAGGWSYETAISRMHVYALTCLTYKCDSDWERLWGSRIYGLARVVLSMSV